MKRILPVILILCLLTGCASLLPDSHGTSSPHTELPEQSSDTNVELVEDYNGLQAAILGFVRDCRTIGRIRISAYDGDVESDLAEAVYAVSKQDPLGAYAVDIMNYESIRIVSYYEITVHITYRRTAEEIAAIETVSNTVVLQERLNQALEDCETLLVLRLNNWWEQDVAAMIDRYCRENPAAVMEVPQVTVTVYPETGLTRILEIGFAYTQEPQVLLEQRVAVAASVSGAANYIRYRNTELSKAKLLYTYLTTLFDYTAGETATPLYSALCDGIADPKGLAQAWQLICDRAGVDCRTVEGARFGEEYVWNIVSVDGVYRHLDLARCILDGTGLVLRTDEEMTEYSWPENRYPVCLPEEKPPETEIDPPVVEIDPPELPVEPIEDGPPEEIGLPVEPEPEPEVS